MKNLLFIALGLVLFTTSCSKERKLNKSLEGTWNLVTVDGVAPVDFAWQFVFTKTEKDAGDFTYTITYTNGVPTETETGTYTLTEDQSINFTFAGEPNPSMIPVNSYSDDVLKLFIDGSILEFKR